MGEGRPSPDGDLRRLPKVELHVHLEGTITAATATALALAHGEDPEEVLPLVDGDYPHRFSGFDHFLRTFIAVSRQVRTPDDLAAVAEAFAREQARQQVRWTEVTFTAPAYVAAGMEADAMWAALRDGLAAAPEAEIGVIVDVVREDGPGAADAIARLVEGADAPIVGLGLTGLEGAAAERDFAGLRAAADRLGLGLTVHAGETGTAANVRAAVEDLGADRVGHGLAVLQDPALTSRLAAAGVPLEVCPSSNAALGLVPGVAAHPLADMRAAGLTVTVGSDDPPFFATTLTDELALATALLDLDRDGLADLQVAGARAAFAPRRTRDHLLAAVDAWRAAE